MRLEVVLSDTVAPPSVVLTEYGVMGMRLKDSAHWIVTERAARLTAAGTGAVGTPVDGGTEVRTVQCSSTQL